MKGLTLERLIKCGIELELYYLECGKYPESLEVLESFRARDFRDFYTAESLQYHLCDDAGFELYSVGPDEEVKPIRGLVREREGYNRIDFFEGVKN